MAQLVKKWNDTDNLTITYSGNGAEIIEVSSDKNEGIDREMPITFKGGGVSVEALVRQEGRREIFNTDDGDFILADGGTFNVIKDGLQ